MTRILYVIASLIAMAVAMASCIEDDFTTSPSAQVTFSTDTLDFGTVFTDDPTTTHRFVAYNRDPRSIMVSRIALSGPDAALFRLNVDGMSGREFSDVEIRGGDSIYVFVEATLPANGDDKPLRVEAMLDFTANGTTTSVALTATGCDVVRLNSVRLEEDTRFTAKRPYVIYDSLVVAPGATLTLEPGTRLCFHDKSYLAVRGTLLSEGTTDNPVVLAGDRTGEVLTGVSFDIMSRQWVGVFFTATSQGSRLVNTVIKNTSQGVSLEGREGLTPDLTMINSRLRNSGDTTFTAIHSRVLAVGCEFAEAANGAVRLRGGEHVFNHCTFANYYLFAVLGGPLLSLSHLSPDLDDDLSGLPYTRATLTNCILYGLGTDLSHGDLTGTDVTLRRCLLRSEGTDDDNFIDCIWGADPLYYTVRPEYYFDYRLRPESPAIAAADPSLTLPDAATDGYGLQRGPTPDLGAYVFVMPETEQ